VTFFLRHSVTYVSDAVML